MASDMKKPMGITTLYKNEIPEKLWPLPVGELYGIGKKSVPKLHQLGIHTIYDLAHANENTLLSHFGDKYAKSMLNSANGISSNLLSNKYEQPKSIGNELTYGSDIKTADRIQEEIQKLSEKVAFRLRKKGLKCKSISIKIKYNDFKVITRSKTLNTLTDRTDLIYDTAKSLALNEKHMKPIRLIGVTVSNFDDIINQQLSLFEEDIKEDKNPDEMVDLIRNKFGYDKIKKGTLIH